MPSLQAAAEHLQSQNGCDGELPCLYGADSGAGSGRDEAAGYAGRPTRSTSSGDTPRCSSADFCSPDSGNQASSRCLQSTSSCPHSTGNGCTVIATEGNIAIGCSIPIPTKTSTPRARTTVRSDTAAGGEATSGPCSRGRASGPASGYARRVKTRITQACPCTGPLTRELVGR